ARQGPGPETGREPVQRKTGDRPDAADVPGAHRRRRGGAAAEQRGLLSGLAQAQGAGRAARLREGTPRAGAGAERAAVRELAPALRGLAARAGTARSELEI